MHRVVITAILLAAKFFDDAYYNNAYYSKVGGVLVSEMNGLEVDFLFRINFSLHVTPEVFEKYKAELVAHSVSSGLAMPQAPLPAPAEIEVNKNPVPYHGLPQGQPTAPIPIQQVATTNPVAPLVTPSPSHVAASHSVTVPIAAAPQVDQVMAHQVYPVNQRIPNITEPSLQRANSLPPISSQQGNRVDSNPVYSSAPMVSMVPVGSIDAEQYIMVNNQLFPLQTTLVHHHHGQTGFHHHQQSYPITTEPMVGSMGSLVAGHY